MVTGTPETAGDGAGLEAGTYEVLRQRMTAAAGDLTARAEELNARRVETFGGSELELTGSDRIRTGHDCVPRDIVQVGGVLLMGCNSPVGPGKGTGAGEGGTADVAGVGDVFSLHRCTGGHFEAAPEDAVPGLLDDPRFRRDFAELYRYFRAARLLWLRRTGSLLLAVFRTSEQLADIRVLRWRIGPDGTPEYLDAKGERDHVLPGPYDFEWTETGRGQHVPGRFPHISVEDTLFVSVHGGALTLKTGNNTDTASGGIHSEPVQEQLQSLGDAELAYARVGPLVLLRVLPYKEPEHRYLVYNERTGEVVRLDGIGQACRRLPEDQGIVFPGGYYVTTAPAGAAAKTFDTDTTDLVFEAAVRSPNGEDVLYAFRAPADGRILLLPYNLIRKQVATPIAAYGHALFEDGTMAVLRQPGDEATRVHPAQVWRTPYVSDSHAAAQPPGTGPLARIGNAELVRAVSDCLSVARMADGMAPGGVVFEAIVSACARVTDLYHWLPADGLGGLDGPVATLRETAGQVIAEFARVEELRVQADSALDTAEREVTALVRRARGEAPDGASGWVALLTALRRAQGSTESLRELRYADTERVDALAAELTASLDATGRRAVTELSREDAFAGTLGEINELAERAGALATVAEAVALGEQIDEQADSLRIVTDVVGGLEIPDATVRTGLLERLGEVMGAVNRARAVLDGRRRELLESEGRAEFAAESALLGQAVAGALAASGTPEECDEQLGRLLLHLENLETRFGSFDDFLQRLTEQREEIYETFSARKQAQLDERARHAEKLADSAERLLGTVARRSQTLADLDGINAFFASDPLVVKVRTTAEELRQLGDQVRGEELEGRLKAARQEAARALRDRADLFDAAGTVRLGRHRFGVNTQPVGLALVPHDGALAFSVTGTDYRSPVDEAEFAHTRAFWDQPLASESPEVYRAEHLAATVLAGLAAGEAGPAAGSARPDAQDHEGLLALVRSAAESAYDEGYDRGVHDHDAARILGALLRLLEGAELLRFAPEVRAVAQLFWAYGADEAARTALTTRARSLGRARAAFGRTAETDRFEAELAAVIGAFLPTLGLDHPGGAPSGDGTAGHPRRRAADADSRASAAYLFEELAAPEGPRFVTGAGARELLADFQTALGGTDSPGVKAFAQDLISLGEDLPARHQLVSAWLGSYLGTHGGPRPELQEAAAIELCGDSLPRRELDAPLHREVSGLLGAHPRVRGGELPLRLDEFLTRTEEFRTTRVPAHRAYTRQRNALLAAERDRLRLDAYEARVMSSFVRNRLIDEVYLPLIGDNLAKQLGTAGEDRRTDSQGLLLLLSPPGYGKTTLMEYVASRLGLVFVKVDGPALGHRTVSLDPAAAPDSAARREVEKINFALEMGNNVFLHLDDIQHTSPELLQKFIPLCDTQRRIDGAEGTYDLRGKRFAVCMAGNPFTESGSRFRIPDMLANRADVWNLGEVLSGKGELFGLSHIENALTSNPVLAPLATRERGDIDLLVRLARGDSGAQADRLSHRYPAAELEQILSVLRKLLYIRETVLAVNTAYIASATQDQAARSEPPFLLQGSYRNTNKLAERIVPVMNEAELEAVLDDHYLAEAQTLTTGAEANLLKLAELRGRMTEGQRARWAQIKESCRSA
ncbi:DNA repair ATPase [Streptomyces sp. N2-109]|uniref:DNA repair ATPase n=1 Tax=Streptomyces gossypii TaxID=2883101 RepID=A0ABT2JSZ2_9ACTN|nr:DNA repair ATPase [Streptomyces gossypii]MCT2591013.1 DNA repair ATPase [Streptomyces gossypii]